MSGTVYVAVENMRRANPYPSTQQSGQRLRGLPVVRFFAENILLLWEEESYSLIRDVAVT